MRARAYEVGFVNVLTEPGSRCRGGRWRWRRQICANAPVSVQACLAAVNDVVAADDDAGLAADRAGARARRPASADAREGVAAFLEKRPPVWTGR